MFKSGSFQHYADMKNQDDLECGGREAANDASLLDLFTDDVDLIKEDMKSMEKLSKRLNEINEESRTIQVAAKMRELRGLMDSEFDHVLMFAKSIIQRIEGLDRFSVNNNPQDKRHSPAGSSIDRTRISVLMGLGKNLRDLMDEFQGLRVRTAAVYKETIEKKYFSISGEKKYIEAIEGLMENGEMEESLTEAILEHGRDGVLDFIAEIHERQEGNKDMQRTLVELHQMFLNMTSLAESQAQKIANGGGGGGGGGGCGGGGGGGGGDQNQMASGNSIMKQTGVAHLQDQHIDYDQEAKRRATIGLILAVLLIFMIIIPLFVAESIKDEE